MKNLISTIFFVITLCLSQLCFAGSVEPGYHSESSAAQAIKTNYATFILVRNLAIDPVYTIVPNSPIYTKLYSGTYFHITHGTFYGDTHIVLQDNLNRIFFDGFVCRYAQISIRGSLNYYYVDIDRSFC